MICTFFGHKDVLDNIKHKLKNSIADLIKTQGVKTFYVGNNGNFDSMVQRTLSEIEGYTDISFCVVLSRIGECAHSAKQDKTLLPHGQESSLPRFAISKRNDWLINHSDFAICYVQHKYSNSWKWMQKAKKRGLTVINLAEIQ